MSEKRRALWVLALLSPVVAELMSGSSPPLEFFFPVSFALLLGLYGAGVLIVRELAVIWDKGWASIIVLGAAYGILEEGVAVKSFFDPEWMDLGMLGEYGRWLGTNWVWAVWLTIYHAVVSISLPILLVGLFFPHLRRERFLTRKQFQIVLLILFLDVLACTTILNPYVPLWYMYALSIVAVFGLAMYSKHIPKRFLMPDDRHPRWSPRKFLVMGFLLLMLCFLISGIFVDTGLPALIPITGMLVLCGMVLLLIKEHIGSSNNFAQQVYLSAGFLSFLLAFEILLALGGMIDMGIVGIFTFVLIFDLTRWSTGRRTLVLFKKWKV